MFTATVRSRLVAWACGIALLWPGPAAAQQGGSADPLMEASLYLRQAQEEMNCSAKSAKQWANKALQALERFRSTSPTERDTAGVLRARTVLLTASIDSREREIERAAAEVTRLLKQSRVESTLLLLERTQTGTPTCDPRFQEWLRIARDRSAQARGLIEEGDAIVDRDPKSALRLYRSAQKIDREVEGIGPRVERAEVIKHSRYGFRGDGATKATLWIVAVGALIGGAAYAAQQKKKQQSGGVYWYRP